MTTADLLAQLQDLARPVPPRDGDRVYFRIMPEARGIVLGGIANGGHIGVKLDGTGQIVFVPEAAIDFEENL